MQGFGWRKNAHCLFSHQGTYCVGYESCTIVSLVLDGFFPCHLSSLRMGLIYKKCSRFGGFHVPSK